MFQGGYNSRQREKRESYFVQIYRLPWPVKWKENLPHYSLETTGGAFIHKSPKDGGDLGIQMGAVPAGK